MSLTSKRIPRAPDPNGAFVVNGAAWNAMAEIVEKISHLAISPPLTLIDTGNNICIGIQPSLGVIPVTITGTATLGGAYNGTSLSGAPSLAGTNSGVYTDPPNGMTAPTSQAVLVLNPAEYGLVSHSLGVLSSRPVLGNVLLVGSSTDKPSVPMGFLLGNAPANCLFAVDLPGTAGGSAGGSNAFCSFTYSVRTKGTNGVSLSGGSPVDWRFVKCKMNPATNGLAYFDESGSVRIAVAFETNDISACS